MEIKNKIDKARSQILNSLKLNEKEYEVVFTSSATESNNLAITGYCLENQNRGKHIITTPIEHASVLNVFKALEKDYGFRVSYLSMKKDGTIDIDDLKSKICKDTILVSTMPVNNETGLILNIKEVNEVIKNYPKCVHHCDCAQTLGKAKFDYSIADMITIASHKIHGLKSIACLIKKKKIRLRPLLYGGGQEFGLRSSTTDYPLISSLNVAIHQTMANFTQNMAQIQKIYDICYAGLKDNPHVKIHKFKNQSPCILNLSLLDKKASVVVEALSNREIYVSSVSACSSKGEPYSYVIENLTGSIDEAKNTIRLSFDYLNTEEEAHKFVEEFSDILENIRS